MGLTINGLVLHQDAAVSAEEAPAYAALQAELLGDSGPQLPVLTERLQRAAKAHAAPDADHSSPAKVRGLPSPS